MITLSPKWQKWLRYLISGLVLGLLLWQTYRLSQEIDAQSFQKGVFRQENLPTFLLVVGLMPVNWILESWKWSILLRPFHTWSFNRVIKAVLAGVSVSAVTPNRIGEIGGRMLRAKKSELAGVVSSSLLGVICQWIVFLTVGGPALLWVVGPQASEQRLWMWLAIIVGLLFIVLLITFGVGGLKQLLRWLSNLFSWDLAPTLAALDRVSTLLLLQATLVAALRFFTYLIQLYLLLVVFGVVLPFWYGLAGIAAIYLIQAGIPLPPGINLITRAQLGILIWGNDPATVAGCLAAFTTLFVVNVLLPSLLTHWLLVRKV